MDYPLNRRKECFQSISVDLVLKYVFLAERKSGESGEGVVQVTDLYYFILKGE